MNLGDNYRYGQPDRLNEWLDDPKPPVLFDGLLVLLVMGIFYAVFIA